MARALYVSRPAGLRHGEDTDEEISTEREVSSEEIDIVVAQLKRITRCAHLEFALRVGAVIVHHFYGGDAAAWRSRGPKNASFRRLAERPDLPLSPGALYRCVALFELCERLKAPSRWEHLGASHLRTVLGLTPKDQERILVAANANRWTVKALQEVILREKAVRVTQGGRRADSQILKTLRMARKCLGDHRSIVDELNALSEQDIEQGMQLLDETRSCLEELSQSLRSAQTRFERLAG